MWLISFRSPIELAVSNLSLLLLEICIWLVSAAVLVHARESSNQHVVLLVCAALVHMLLFSTTRMWYGQTMVMLFGSQLPLFMVSLSAVLNYISYILATRMQLPQKSKPFATALLMLLLYLPLEMVGSKFLWWTFHDTDPIVFDRFLDTAPFSMLCYHLCRSTIFTMLYDVAKNHFHVNSISDCGAGSFSFLKQRKWLYRIIFTVFLTPPLAFLFFACTYHLFHDVIGVSAKVCFLLFVSFYLLAIWTSDRNEGAEVTYVNPVLYDVDARFSWYDHTISQCVIIYNLFIFLLMLTIDPANITSTGFHQKLGDCRQKEIVDYFVTNYQRQLFLCSHKYDEDFNFCNYPSNQLHYNEPWYMICGEPFKDYLDFIVLVAGLSFITWIVVVQILSSKFDNQIPPQLSNLQLDAEQDEVNTFRKTK